MIRIHETLQRRAYETKPGEPMKITPDEYLDAVQAARQLTGKPAEIVTICGLPFEVVEMLPSDARAYAFRPTPSD